MLRRHLRRLAARWPGLVVVIAFLAGFGVGGFGLGVLMAFLSVLVAGPAYLLQTRRRRRRGIAPSGRGFDRDANEAITALAAAELRLFNRYRSLRLGTLVLSSGMVVALWIVAGRGWALAVLVVWGLATLVSIAKTVNRRRSGG